MNVKSKRLRSDISGILMTDVFLCEIIHIYIYKKETINVTFFQAQVIEKHYGRSLGVWSETAATLAKNGTEEAGQMPAVIMYWSLSVAIFSVGGMMSSFLVGFVGDLRGR